MTGIANERGHVKRLEHRIRELEGHIRGLEGRLMSLGEDVKPWNMDSDPHTALLSWNRPQEHELYLAWNSANINTEEHSPSLRVRSGFHEASSPLPEFRYSLSGDNYLGVCSGNSFISSICGTTLNVLGTEIDLADYVSADLDGPDRLTSSSEYPLNKSYHAFVQTAYGAKPKPSKVQLPPQHEGIAHANRSVSFRLLFLET